MHPIMSIHLVGSKFVSQLYLALNHLEKSLTRSPGCYFVSFGSLWNMMKLTLQLSLSLSYSCD